MRRLAAWSAGLALAAFALLPAFGITVSQRLLFSFGDPPPSPFQPTAPVIQGADGKLYGTLSQGGPGNAGIIFRVNPDGTLYEVLRSFATSGGNPGVPYAPLVLGPGNKLYGTAFSGGANGRGAVFVLDLDGTGFAVVRSFSGSALDGSNPYAGLTLGSDGKLYGTTYQGGSLQRGTVFRMNTDGTGFELLHSFTDTAGAGDGAYPQAPVIFGPDGLLYGTTRQGGSDGRGTVFRLNADGTGYAVLHSFTTTGGDGQYPIAPLLAAADGKLYGATPNGGAQGSGAVFRLDLDGSHYGVLFSFQYSTGYYPQSPLVQDAAGTLYGTAYYGGTAGRGTVFALQTDGTGYAPLHEFSHLGGDANYPIAALLLASDGRLFGTAQGGGAGNRGALFALQPNGTEYQVVHSFRGDSDPGINPQAGLAAGPDGTLYGTTYSGGAGNLGTVYRVQADGTGHQVLHSFLATGGDGVYPQTGVILASDGNLYGTTPGGGSQGSGTLFRLHPDGTGYEILRSVSGSDGSAPFGGLTQAADGKLYGCNAYGGTSGGGTLFRLELDGSGFEVVFHFASPSGANPYAPLIQGADGKLYGSTQYGGSASFGTLFRIDTDGSDYEVLHHFAGATGNDGSTPRTALAQAGNGTLFGTTSQGGTPNQGTLFRVQPDGTGYAVVHHFASSSGGGYYPQAPLLVGSGGILYGTTQSGGGGNGGTLFTLNPDGSGLQFIHGFSYSAAGSAPVGNLVQDTVGRLYGVAQNGGAGAARGTIFRLTVNRAIAYHRLHSFWRAPTAPYGAVLQASDGTLFGTTSGGGTTDRGIVFQANADGSNYRIVHTFAGSPADGANPYASLIQATDGKLYGTTQSGGANNAGTLYRLDLDGTGFLVVYHFAYPTGGGPAGPVLQGSDGKLYGTTLSGGSGSRGVVFRVELDGTGYQVLHPFTGTSGDGANPYTGLIEASDGKLYGTTYNGGTANLGTVFRLGRDGSGYEVLRSLLGTTGDGAYPWAPLTQASDGRIYGATYRGGTDDRGALFRLQPDGTGYELIRSFAPTGGGALYPYAGLLEVSPGLLYGLTTSGGTFGNGTVFRLQLDGSSFEIVHSLTYSEGSGPRDRLILRSDGKLLGVANSGTLSSGGSVFALDPDGTDFQVLCEIAAGGDPGYRPSASPVQGSDGYLYGTTQNGGPANRGTVYRLAPGGTSYQLLHGFTETSGDGGFPTAGLLQADDGRLYGTTQNGGNLGGGTLFRLQPDGSGYEIVHHFAYATGGGPSAALIQLADGLLYGTTQYGGTSGNGTVFRIARDGTLHEVLHHFTGGANDGGYPRAPLFPGTDGFLYGTTQYGGPANSGTVFRLHSSSLDYRLLYAFLGTAADQGFPAAGVIQASDGRLYGTTPRFKEGAWGTVFRLNADGTGYQRLREFTTSAGDGNNPMGALVQNDDGLLYGTTASGGTSGAGTLFRLALDGADYEIIYSPTQNEGSALTSGLARGRFGALYGVTQSGGASQQGTVFRLVLRTVLAARHVFYNQSVFDGNNAAANDADDAAIAPDKTALLPGGKATFANYTTYSRGLNGLMVDIMGLTGLPTAADFELRAGNNATPNAWSAAPAPASVGIRRGAGLDGSDRITLVWGADAVKKKWLRTTVLASPATGLAQPDVFYFGNAIGETGNSAADARVAAADALRVLNNLTASAAVANRFDINRDGKVGAADRLIILGNLSALDPVILLDLAGGGASPGTASAASTPTEPGLALLATHAGSVGLRVQWVSTGAPVTLWTTESLTAPDWDILEEFPTASAPGTEVEVVLPVDPDAPTRFYRLESGNGR
jgi:uncharacterized repeat protein (TIGR03803 family)